LTTYTSGDREVNIENNKKKKKRAMLGKERSLMVSFVSIIILGQLQQ